MVESLPTQMDENQEAYTYYSTHKLEKTKKKQHKTRYGKLNIYCGPIIYYWFSTSQK